MARRRLSREALEARQNEVIRLASAGRTAKEIAAEMDISLSSVYGDLNRVRGHGKLPRRVDLRNRIEEEYEELISMVERGMTFEEIAEATGEDENQLRATAERLRRRGYIDQGRGSEREREAIRLRRETAYAMLEHAEKQGWSDWAMERLEKVRLNCEADYAKMMAEHGASVTVPRRQTFPLSDRDGLVLEVVRLRDTGFTWSEIAAALSIGRTTARDYYERGKKSSG